MNRSKSRLRKTQCDKCGAILYGSRKSITQACYGRAPGVEIPPGLRCSCGGHFNPYHLEDREAIERSNEK